MKVYRRTEAGTEILVIFQGVCIMEVPRTPWLLVQQDEKLVEIYSLMLHAGQPVVMLGPDQTPHHLPHFMSEAECIAAMTAQVA